MIDGARRCRHISAALRVRELDASRPANWDLDGIRPLRDHIDSLWEELIDRLTNHIDCTPDRLDRERVGRPALTAASHRAARPPLGVRGRGTVANPRTAAASASATIVHSMGV